MGKWYFAMADYSVALCRKTGHAFIGAITGNIAFLEA
jgi:hypothetical protein